MLTLASRWPYRARMLYNWDAVQFALALARVRRRQASAASPGLSPLRRAGPARQSLGGTIRRSPMSASRCCSARRRPSWSIGWRGASTIARPRLPPPRSSPSARSSGSTARSGSRMRARPSAPPLVAWWAWGALEGRARHLYLGALTLGLVGGMRQSVLVLIFPLWLGCGGARHALVAARRRRGRACWRRAVLAWLLPTIWLSGGLAAYVAASTQLYGSVVLPTSVLGGSLDVTFAQARYLAESVIVGLGPLALAFLALPAYVRRAGWGRQEWFLLAWILPPAAFYTLVHFGQAGLCPHLPARAGDPARARAGGGGRGGLRAAAPAELALGADRGGPGGARRSSTPASSPAPVRCRASSTHRAGDAWIWRARDEIHDWIMSRTAAALREHEAVIRTYVETIRAVYDPDDTALLTELGNPRSYPWLRHAMFYLPEYPIYQVQLGDAPGYYAPQSRGDDDPDAGLVHRAAAPGEAARVVRRSLGSRPCRGPPGLLEIQLPYGRFLYVLPLGARPSTPATPSFAPRATDGSIAPWCHEHGERAARRRRGRGAVLVAAAARSRCPVSPRARIAGAASPRVLSARRLVDPPPLRAQPRRGRGLRATTPACPWRARRRRSGRCCWRGTFSLAGTAPAWAKALGIAAALATALLTRRLVWMWTESRALALAGGVIAAVAGPLVWGALSGMEVSLAALLVTAAIVSHTARRDARDGAAPRPRASSPGPRACSSSRSSGWAGRSHRGRTAIFAGIVGASWRRGSPSISPRRARRCRPPRRPRSRAG